MVLVTVSSRTADGDCMMSWALGLSGVQFSMNLAEFT